MAVQTVFKRYELKYLMTREQQKLLLKIMDGHMALDKYGHTTIRNIYFDTDNYRLVRHSIEGPPYKEKLRIRSYSHVSGNDNVFVELKKKYKSVVYKRRLVLPLDETMEALTMHRPLPTSSQIADEINYFCSYYRTLRPAVFLSYEREAFYSTDGSDFRVTFDENILYRDEDISLSGDIRNTYNRKKSGAHGNQNSGRHSYVDDRFSHRTENIQDILFQVRSCLQGHGSKQQMRVRLQP